MKITYTVNCDGKTEGYPSLLGADDHASTAAKSEAIQNVFITEHSTKRIMVFKENGEKLIKPEIRKA